MKGLGVRVWGLGFSLFFSFSRLGGAGIYASTKGYIPFQGPPGPHRVHVPAGDAIVSSVVQLGLSRTIVPVRRLVRARKKRLGKVENLEHENLVIFLCSLWPTLE